MALSRKRGNEDMMARGYHYDGSYILLACYFVAADYLAPSVLPILLMLLAIDI